MTYRSADSRLGPRIVISVLASLGTGRSLNSMTREYSERVLEDARLVEVEIRETHRLHEYAGSNPPCAKPVS